MDATVSKTDIKNALVTESVQDFMQKNGLSVHNAVRTNANGYPYLTFINKENVAENVYFAKTISADYKKDQAVVKGFFTGLQIGYTTNEAGEERTKIIPIGNGTRLETSDLF